MDLDMTKVENHCRCVQNRVSMSLQLFSKLKYLECRHGDPVTERLNDFAHIMHYITSEKKYI